MQDDLKSRNFVTLVQETEYRNTFPKIIPQLENHADNHFGSKMNSEVAWLRQVMEQNLDNLDKKYGLITLAMGNVLGNEIPDLELQRWNTVATVMDMNHAAQLMSNKIMDESKFMDKAHKQISWHCIPSVGLNAINDSFMLQMEIHNIIQLTFNGTPTMRYQLEDMFRKTHEKSVLGKAIEERMKRSKNIGISYTKTQFRQVVNLKLSYYRFYTPIACAWILKEKWENPEVKLAIKLLAFEIGYFAKLGEDLEEYFSDRAPAFVGEPLSKFNWPFVCFLKQVKKDENAQKQILALVNHLQLGNLYEAKRIYEDKEIHRMLLEERKKSAQKIREMVENLPEVVTCEVNNLHAWKNIMEIV